MFRYRNIESLIFQDSREISLFLNCEDPLIMARYYCLSLHFMHYCTTLLFVTTFYALLHDTIVRHYCLRLHSMHYCTTLLFVTTVFALLHDTIDRHYCFSLHPMALHCTIVTRTIWSHKCFCVFCTCKSHKGAKRDWARNNRPCSVPVPCKPRFLVLPWLDLLVLTGVQNRAEKHQDKAPTNLFFSIALSLSLSLSLSPSIALSNLLKRNN